MLSLLPPLCCYTRVCPTLPAELAANPEWLAQGLSTAAAAHLLGVAPATLETLRSRGGGPVFEKLGRTVRYRRCDLLSHKLAATRRNSCGAAGAVCDCGKQGGLP